jgi:hypothetical protein
MESLFKSVGKGLLYLLVLPFFLLVISGYAIAGLIVFIYLFFKSIVLFFMGRSLDIELPEDKKAKQIIQKAIPASTNPVIKQDGAPQSETLDNIVLTTSKTFVPYDEPSNVEEACFGIDIESEKQSEPSKEKVLPPVSVNELHSINATPSEEKKIVVKTNDIPQDDIPLGKYSPKKTHFDDLDDEDNGKEKAKEKDSGVDIHFKDF